MTPKETARRIDALHYGTERRRELCTMLAYRESDLQDARATIASLRRGLEAQAEEIERLRELVRIMAYCMQYERECDGCRMNGAAGTITAPAGCDGLLDRMRELGIEVLA